MKNVLYTAQRRTHNAIIVCIICMTIFPDNAARAGLGRTKQPEIYTIANIACEFLAHTHAHTQTLTLPPPKWLSVKILFSRLVKSLLVLMMLFMEMENLKIVERNAEKEWVSEWSMGWGSEKRLFDLVWTVKYVRYFHDMLYRLLYNIVCTSNSMWVRLSTCNMAIYARRYVYLGATDKHIVYVNEMRLYVNGITVFDREI